MRLLIIAPYPPDRAPSQRFRFEQYLDRLEEDGVEWSLRPLMDRAAYERFHRPGGALRKGIALLRGLARRLRDVRDAAEFDVVLVHREAFPVGGAFLERRIARTGTPLVFDFDDAIYRLDVSPANRWAAALKRPEKTAEIVSLSRLVLAGNDVLADYARRSCDDVRILPTVIDTEAYRCPETTAEAPGDVTVGWTGSVTTLAHLRELEPVLEALQAELGVGIRIVGVPEYRPERDFEAEVMAWSPETEVEGVCGMDVGVMPLPDEEWAKGKCGLKLLQYMAAGRPGVASPVGVNREIVDDGENGLLASTHAEWKEALRRLVTDAELRRRMGRAARRRVEERYSVDSSYPVFLEALRDAAGAGSGPGRSGRSGTTDREAR